MSSKTYQLLKIIGSPFIDSHKELGELDFDDLYLYSKKNRMPLLFLRSLIESDIRESNYKDYSDLVNRWVEIEKRIKKVIQLLGENGIKYATFKSIKPYPEVTVDIDFLILNSYEKALDRLQGAGYKLIERGPLSSTMRDPEIKIDYDIYDEVGVSNIIYFDKDKAADYIVEKQFQTGGYIVSLSPSIDLLAVIAHSVIKEQMYTLAEYYTTLYYLHGMDEEDLRIFIEMADSLSLRYAVRAHVGLTYCIHRMAHGVEPLPLKRIVSAFGLDDLEAGRMKRVGYEAPQKFHPITLSRSFWEKLHECKSRRSFARQARSMMSPGFTMAFFTKFLSHVVRETY